MEYKEESHIMTDSRIAFERDLPYDVPSEADVLIVYQKSCVFKKKKECEFLEEFCINLKEYGVRDDIMGLLIRIKCDPRPLIISTLRKKFYISSSNFREHFFDIESYSRRMLETLESLQNRMGKIGKSRKIPFHASVSVDKCNTESHNTPPKQAKQARSAKNLLVSDGPRNRKASSTTSIAKREKDQPESKKVWKF